METLFPFSAGQDSDHVLLDTLMAVAFNIGLLFLYAATVAAAVKLVG